MLIFTNKLGYSPPSRISPGATSYVPVQPTGDWERSVNYEFSKKHSESYCTSFQELKMENCKCESQPLARESGKRIA